MDHHQPRPSNDLFRQLPVPLFLRTFNRPLFGWVAFLLVCQVPGTVSWQTVNGQTVIENEEARSDNAPTTEARAEPTDTATMRVRFVYSGPPLKDPFIKPDRDVAFCSKMPIPNETLIVNPENHGIKNVILSVDARRSPTKPPAETDPPRRRLFELKDCRLQPRVLITRVGDTLEVVNRDKVGHNLNIQFFNNPPSGITIPPQGPSVRELSEAEPAAVPVACNIHPWIKGQLLVLTHRLAAISDDRGLLEIEGLPVGEKLTFRVSHETLRLENVSVNSEAEQWRRQRFTVTLHAGVHDLGVVDLGEPNLRAANIKAD